MGKSTLTTILVLSMTATALGEDKYLWLEDITGKEAMAYVEAQNATTLAELQARPEFERIETQAITILDSADRIPYVGKMGKWYYNLWQDKANPKGLWRRTTLEEYKKEKPVWETVLDLDALAAAEHENWVWSGSATLPPNYKRTLIHLSRGGGDAVVVREFDLETKSFVTDGFNLPEAKSNITWRDINTVYVGTDFGPDSRTDSGYPRLVKRWTRGTPLSSAETVFSCLKTDIGVQAWVDLTPGFFREGIKRMPAFYESEVYLGITSMKKLDVPLSAEVEFFNEWLLVQLRDDWTIGPKTYRAGSLLATKLDNFATAGPAKSEFTVLFAPTPRVALQNVDQTKNTLLLELSNNVSTRIMEATPHDGSWDLRQIRLPGTGSATATAVDSLESDDVWFGYEDFLTPRTLAIGKVGDDFGSPLKSLPAFFSTAGMVVEQQETKSADGTAVPYFVVGKRDAINSGTAPTLLYGYGGFEIPLCPYYSAVAGRSWLEDGGVFVLANIRGGGEFGPTWHQAAVRGNRQRAFDDFEAIAADIAKRGITTARHLGIMGGSNGGLLVSTVAIQRPELFQAVVCQVPLTDMQRYNKLLAGASWMAEYGDQDKPEDWAYLSKYSPYQNVQASGHYPRILFTTSTRDDRVHPGHARKMYAKMKDQGHNVLYYENTEGGHAGAADNKQKARMTAIEYTFLWEMLK